MKNKPKIRAVWAINPKTRIKEDKRPEDNYEDICNCCLFEGTDFCRTCGER